MTIRVQAFALDPQLRYDYARNNEIRLRAAGSLALVRLRVALRISAGRPRLGRFIPARRRWGCRRRAAVAP